LLDDLAGLVGCCDQSEVLRKFDPVNTAAIHEVVAKFFQFAASFVRGLRDIPKLTLAVPVAVSAEVDDFLMLFAELHTLLFNASHKRATASSGVAPNCIGTSSPGFE
jgi:hypothetical protein